ncbi:MAG: glycerol-3-phosphate 1-O-acyltransferase PlsY [Chloroflexi bacterium]|nr:glycerol-3-phosphate 1-O-acyltransferase PlsY [Chloroflexota bacterium]
MHWPAIFEALAVGYLLGSIPPGLVLGKVLRGIDIRNYGSGKIGATNVQRTLGWGPAILTLLLDVSKGAAAVVVARALAAPLSPPFSDLAVSLGAVAVVIGHNWSVFLGWRGGRGIAPAIGAASVIAPWAGLPAVLVGAVLVRLSDMVSLGSVGGTLAGLLIFAFGALIGWLPSTYLAFAAPATAVLVASHHDNLARILQGRERRLGLRR